MLVFILLRGVGYCKSSFSGVLFRSPAEFIIELVVDPFHETHNPDLWCCFSAFVLQLHSLYHVETYVLFAHMGFWTWCALVLQ